MRGREGWSHILIASENYGNFNIPTASLMLHASRLVRVVIRKCWRDGDWVYVTLYPAVGIGFQSLLSRVMNIKQLEAVFKPNRQL